MVITVQQYAVLLTILIWRRNFSAALVRPIHSILEGQGRARPGVDLEDSNRVALTGSGHPRNCTVDRAYSMMYIIALHSMIKRAPDGSFNP